MMATFNDCHNQILLSESIWCSYNADVSRYVFTNGATSQDNLGHVILQVAYLEALN